MLNVLIRLSFMCAILTSLLNWSHHSYAGGAHNGIEAFGHTLLIPLDALSANYTQIRDGNIKNTLLVSYPYQVGFFFFIKFSNLP